MMRRMLSVAVVAACCVATLAAPPSDAATTDRASFGAQLVAFARSQEPSVPSAQDAGDVTPSASSCLHEEYSDPTGDGGALDANHASIDYDCPSKSWSAAAYFVSPDTETATDSLTMYVDRDHNSATGCFGDDVAVVGYVSIDEEWVGDAVNTPNCSPSSWTVRTEIVAASFPAINSILLSFPHTIIGTNSFGWWIHWIDTDNGEDALPNTGYRTTLLPGVRSIQFRTAQYNAPGTDTTSNASLNNEWVSIRNYGPTTKNLKGYTVRDLQNNRYTFTTNFYLAADKFVRIHTGKGTNTATDRYWGRTAHVWGNTIDTATLRNSANAVLDTCRWTAPGAGSKLCAT